MNEVGATAIGAEIDTIDDAVSDVGTQALGLATQVFHHLGACSPIGIAGEVIDFGGLCQLSTADRAFVNHWLKART